MEIENIFNTQPHPALHSPARRSLPAAYRSCGHDGVLPSRISSSASIPYRTAALNLHGNCQENDNFRQDKQD